MMNRVNVFYQMGYQQIRFNKTAQKTDFMPMEVNGGASLSHPYLLLCIYCMSVIDDFPLNIISMLSFWRVNKEGNICQKRKTKKIGIKKVKSR